jgi:DNA-binding SARP family transcriptional activator
MEREARIPVAELLTGHYLQRDPDVLVLRHLDGSVIGAFSPRRDAPETARLSEAPSPGQPVLRVRFFGHFEASCDGEPLPVSGGKALAIFKYLLAHRGRPVSQDHLMAWLWPESSLTKARWSLNSAIHGLRKLLNDHPAPSLNYVLLEEGHYHLSPVFRVETDADELDARFAEGLRLEKAGRRAEAAVEYEKGAELYRGEYLVEDLYEDWTMVERERLSNAYLDMMDRLAAYHLEAGRPREGIRICYRVLEKDRCHEDAHRLLMRCYARLGLRGRALRQYHLCKEALRREYGLAPTPETDALRRTITAGRDG